VPLNDKKTASKSVGTEYCEKVMNSLKPAVIAGALGFGLSLLVALVSGVRGPMLLLRPLIFGGVFLAFGAVVLYLYRRFLVVLPGEHGETGNNVDISIDDDDNDDDDDAGMMVGEADALMDYTGFSEVNTPSQNEVSDGLEGGDAASGTADAFHQDTKGLEQNSAISYTNEKDTNYAFMPMDFYDLKGDADEMSQSVVPPYAGTRKVYARVPEKGGLANTDPKKLASTVQDLLSDE
jgi:hypothetical protein